MRVTFNSIYREAMSGIEGASARKLDFQRQVATGKRVERASDDPSAISQVIQERAQQASLDQYTQSANSAAARLAIADTALSDVITHLTAAQVAVVSARGSQKTPAEREAAALQLEALRDALLTDVNTQHRGTYVFGGAAGTTRPYTSNGGNVSAYQGSTTEVAVDIERGIEVTIAFNAESFVRGTDADDMFAVINQAITAARNGDQATLSTTNNALERVLERATAMQSRIGAGQRSVEDDLARLSSATRASEARVASLEDTNLAQAISGMQQADQAYQAAIAAMASTSRLSLMDYLK